MTECPHATVALSKSDQRWLSKSLALASARSNAPDGERLAAIAAAERLLAKYGLSLSDLRPLGTDLGAQAEHASETAVPDPEPTAPEPEWGDSDWDHGELPWWDLCTFCLLHEDDLETWEVGILRGILSSNRRPAPAQERWLNELTGRLIAQEEAA